MCSGGNHVQHIPGVTWVGDWHYVPMNCNPADLSSWEVITQELIKYPFGDMTHEFLTSNEPLPLILEAE